MLYIFHGNDRKKVADQVFTLTQSLIQKKPDAQTYTFEGKELYANELDALIEAQGLFAQRHIVTIKEAMQETESRAVLVERLERIAHTDNIFIILENKLLPAHKKKLEKYAEKIEEHTAEKKSEDAFNIFSLSDDLGKKNKRTLWLRYREALEKGVEVESIHGTLHWAVRGMLFALQSTNAEEAGQKPFMFQKQKTYGKNYDVATLRKLSRELIDIYHNARRGKGDMNIALEHWILSL